MTKYGKWIGGFIGLVAGGPLGALAGFVLGSLLDEGADNIQYINDNSYGYGSSAHNSAQSQPKTCRVHALKRSSVTRSSSRCLCWRRTLSAPTTR